MLQVHNKTAPFLHLFILAPFPCRCPACPIPHNKSSPLHMNSLHRDSDMKQIRQITFRVWSRIWRMLYNPVDEYHRTAQTPSCVASSVLTTVDGTYRAQRWIVEGQQNTSCLRHGTSEVLPFHTRRRVAACAQVSSILDDARLDIQTSLPLL